MAAYGWLKKELELLCGSIFALRAACQRWSLEELAAAQGTQGYQEQEQATSAVCSALATAAACCAGCAEALEHMPPLGACSGEIADQASRSVACMFSRNQGDTVEGIVDKMAGGILTLMWWRLTRLDLCCCRARCALAPDGRVALVGAPR